MSLSGHREPMAQGECNTSLLTHLIHMHCTIPPPTFLLPDLPIYIQIYPACTLRFLGLLLADDVLTMGWGKIFAASGLTKTAITWKQKVAK